MINVFDIELLVDIEKMPEYRYCIGASISSEKDMAFVLARTDIKSGKMEIIFCKDRFPSKQVFKEEARQLSTIFNCKILWQETT